MQRSIALRVLAVLILLPVLLPVMRVQAALELTPAEEYVRREMLADGQVDLLDYSADENERVVRGEFLVELWEDPAFQTIPFFKLYNANVQGDIQAEGITIPFNVELHTSTFTGGINLASTQVQTFRIDDSTVAGPVKMDRMVVNGDLALYNSTFEGGVTLFGADIGNNLFARSSEFLSTEPVPNSAFPFELWTTRVGQATEFTDAVFMGEVKADEAKFGADLRFNNAVFEMPASFKSIQVGNIANFEKAHFKSWVNFDSSVFSLDARFPEAAFDGEATYTNIRVVNKADFQAVVFKDKVSFESSIMERDAAFTGAVFHGDARFDYVSVNRFFDFDQTTLKRPFSFTYSTVGWPYFNQAWFEGMANFEGLEATNTFDLTDATFRGLVKFEGVQASKDLDLTGASYINSSSAFIVTLSDVAGAVKFANFTAPAGLHLVHNHLGDLTISAPPGARFDSINLSATRVNGDFVMENVRTNTFRADGFSASDSTTFRDVGVAQTLDMSNASVGFFNFDRFSWPLEVDAFNLRGMTYTDIGLSSRELNDDTWSVLLDMVEQSAYSPQAYRTLGQFLTEKGHPDWAAEVELSRKTRERDQILTPRSTPWFWSWFLYIFSGYGQRPDFAFIWSAFVIAIGAVVFRREEDMVVLDQSDAKPPYNPILYSFAVFLPYIDLGIASKWDPKPHRKFAGFYKHIHRLLGWVLMPIALLTFGGIIN